MCRIIMIPEASLMRITKTSNIVICRQRLVTITKVVISSFNTTAFRSSFIYTIMHRTDFVSLSRNRFLLHTHCTLTSTACEIAVRFVLHMRDLVFVYRMSYVVYHMA